MGYVKANCKICGKKIMFLPTEKMHRIPVGLEEYKTDSENEIVMVRQEELFVRQSGAGLVGYVPHWATCKDVKRFIE